METKPMQLVLVLQLIVLIMTLGYALTISSMDDRWDFKASVIANAMKFQACLLTANLIYLL